MEKFLFLNRIEIRLIEEPVEPQSFHRLFFFFFFLAFLELYRVQVSCVDKYQRKYGNL